MFDKNVMKVFFHNMEFKEGKSSYYLSINKYSDRTPEELKRMYSDVTFGDEFGFVRKIEKGAASSFIEKQRADLNLQQLEKELKRVNEEKRPGFDMVAKELSIMIQNVKNNVSNNGGENQNSESDWTISKEALLHFDSNEFDMEVSADTNGKVLIGANGGEDKFVDLRKSGCLTVLAREQGDCGSSYAFTAIALMEFAHCQCQRGKLVSFSEQYMIDCGQKHVEKMRGCEGADLIAIPTFLADWGVDLRSNFPKVEGENSCPYHENEWSHAGYKKPSADVFKVVFEKAYWPTILKQIGPMIAALQVPSDFSSYGGRIHQGQNCHNKDGFHAMLLVGHGIENGEEYWLYKNSYGHEWGEEGYFKLSKEANPNCFGPHMFSKFTFY